MYNLNNAYRQITKSTKLVNEYKQAVKKDIKKLSVSEITRKHAFMAGFCGLTLNEAAQVVAAMAAQAQK